MQTEIQMPNFTLWMADIIENALMNDSNLVGFSLVNPHDSSFARIFNIIAHFTWAGFDVFSAYEDGICSFDADFVNYYWFVSFTVMSVHCVIQAELRTVGHESEWEF